MVFNTNEPVEPVARLIEEFNKLPGIGPKSAQRITYYLLRSSVEQARELANAIVEMKEKIRYCSTCFNITEEDPCTICTNDSRDRTKICVVEEPLDVLAIERTRSFKGLYHVLHGAVSPQDGISTEDLRVRELVGRLRGGEVREVILATNPSLVGQATAYALVGQLGPLGVRITKIATGLPVGGDLEYADEMTLTRAFEGRQELR
ncbi:MAG TPA: recombination mediator RecR [Dehalococcoidia bacterium]|nr:recombination mediator RecR [Dehalococcoidia bacterium]